MRCADLAETWNGLCAWFDQHGVLVLPQLYADRPLVRLGADADPCRTTDPAELDRQIGQLRTIIKHFGVRAVYVHQLRGEPRDGTTNPIGDGVEKIAVVTIRVVADGVVHELTLFAAWYAEFLDDAIGKAPAHIP